MESARLAAQEIVLSMSTPKGIDKNFFDLRASAHISLSNSSCFENTRSTGGRAEYTTQCVKTWLERVGDVDEEIYLPIGLSYSIKEGLSLLVTCHP